MTEESTRTPRPLVGRILPFDLQGEARALRAEEVFRTRGHNARTLVKHPDLRVVLMAFARGARMQEHETDQRVSVQTVRGHVRLTLPEGGVDLPAGHLLVIDQSVPHGVEALEDSEMLISMSWTKK